MAAASSSPVVLLLVVACFCCSFVNSGILPGPVRGYETYEHSFSSQRSQSYDSRSGLVQSYSLTSRQCSVLRRRTQYETVRIPFLCHGATSQVVPFPPPHMDSQDNLQVLRAMQAGGWTLCHQTVTVPIYRYQRIPVCCPGSTPTPQGSCVTSREGSSGTMPSPGQLLQSSANIFTDQQASPHPGYTFLQSPRPYRGMLRKVSPGSLKANSLLRQVTLSRGMQGGPSYTVDRTRAPLGSPGMTEWHSDIARYLAAMMYQTLLVEQQQKRLQDELGKQLRLRHHMEILYALKQQKLQQQQQQLRQNHWGAPQQSRAFSSSPFPSPPPNPIPSPPINPIPSPPINPIPSPPINPIPSPPIQVTGVHTEPFELPTTTTTTVAPPDLDETQGVPDARQSGAMGEGAVEEGEGEGEHPMFNNGAPNIPPGILETKEKVEGIVDDCLKTLGFPSMEAILQSGEVAQIIPVCRSSPRVGRCVVQGADSGFGRDQLGMVGRHMTQALLRSLGQLCSRVDRQESTSPPVFPNPPPPVTPVSVVTKVSGSIVSGGDSKPATDSKDQGQPGGILMAQGPPGLNSKPPASDPKKEEIMTVGSQSPLGMPGVTPSPRGGEKEEKEKSGDHYHHHHHHHQGGEASAHMSITKTSHGSGAGSGKGLLHQTAVGSFPLGMVLVMVGACALLLLLTCLTVCLLIRCRRHKKTVELERQPEKLPHAEGTLTPAPVKSNIYAASPCQPPPSYPTTPVRQTLGGGEEEEEDMEEDGFKIPEDDDVGGKVVEEEKESQQPEKEEKEEKEEELKGKD